MSDIEFKSFSKTAHSYLHELLENEKALRPETYAGAANIGAKMRQYFIDFGQLDTLPPIPTLEKKEK